jgi:hypothetical protein
MENAFLRSKDQFIGNNTDIVHLLPALCLFLSGEMKTKGSGNKHSQFSVLSFSVAFPLVSVMRLCFLAHSFGCPIFGFHNVTL